jgi:DNA-binding MarR family transcriptional regulator
MALADVGDTQAPRLSIWTCMSDRDAFEAEPLGAAWLQGLLGFQIAAARKAVLRDFGDRFARIDLTLQQFATLNLIKLHPGAPQVALASQLGVDRATMMTMIDRLEGRGLLTRERSKTDRRRQEVILTRAGEAMVEEARALILAHEAQFTARFTADELDLMFDFLRRLQDR